VLACQAALADRIEIDLIDRCFATGSFPGSLHEITWLAPALARYVNRIGSGKRAGS
jgi:hypothetical protein